MAIINTQIKGGGGVQPVGTLGINANGVYDVSSYANADVQVPSSAPSWYVQKKIINGQLSYDDSAPIMNFSGITYLGDFMLPYAFAYNNYTGDVDMSEIQTVGSYSGYYTFFNSSIRSIDLSSLTSAAYNYCCSQMFGQCKNLITADISGIVNLTGNSAFYRMFCDCSSLTTVDLSSLTTISQLSGCREMFMNCTSLTSVNLSSLTTVGEQGCFGMFQGCTSLTDIDLSSVRTCQTNAFSMAFYGCKNLRRADLSGVVTHNNSFGSTFSGCSSLETVILSDALCSRNPPNLLANLPLTTCEYADKLEYITVSVNSLCESNMFPTANMKKFELVNVSAIYMFRNNTALTSIKFPVLTRWNGSSSAAYMFNGCTNANFTDLSFPMLQIFRNQVPFTTTSFPSQLTVHFRKDQQTIIMNTSGSSSAFGANALVFDLIGTITVSGVDYIRQGKCDESGYYAWQKKTSNITVGGTVYTFDIQEITRNTAPVVTGPIIYGWKNGSSVIYTDSLKPQVGDYIWTRFDASRTTTPITAVDNEYIYTVDSAEPAVGDTVYSDAQGTVLGTIDAVA